MFTVNRDPDARELRKFAAAMLAGFGVLGAISWYVAPDPNGFAWQSARGQYVALGLWGAGVALALIGIGPKAVARPVYVAWMSVAMVMGTVVTTVLLSLMFVLLLPVFSLIRLGDPLRMKLRPAGESYWEDHTHHASTLERTIRPF